MSNERISELESNIREWRKAYYSDKKPLVTDSVYDDAEDELRSLDPENPVFSEVGSETDATNKRKHKIAMGSQAKIKIDDDGVDGIQEIINKFIGKKQCCVSYKMDGISFAVDYVDGKYQHATTRGDGFIGDDIPNATEFDGIDEEIYEDFTLTFRGELVIHYDDFETINSQLSDDDKFSNPRNAVAGIARKVDSPFRKYIKAYYYDANGKDVEDCTGKHEIFGTLVMCFPLSNVVWYDMEPNADSFRELAERLNTERKDLPYMIDGLVIEFEDLAYAKSLGVANGNKPKGSVALKFDAVAETTCVTDVVWQVGSTGNLTPVVEFEPTLIDGSIVRRASIHNYDIFKQWNFGKGDVIEVQKNNDIIPQVKSVVKYSDEPRFIVPAHCPVCDCETHHEKIAKTTNLVCFNIGCPAKYIGNIKKWATKSGMASKGVGDAFFEAYAQSNDFHGPEELYNLTVEDIMGLSDRYKEKSATKIYNAIQSSKTMKMMDFFGGLNIFGAGSRTFKKIIEAQSPTLNSVFELFEYMTSNDLTTIDGIGDITARNIVDGLKSLEDTISMLSSIIDIEIENLPTTDGKSFLFTGSFNTIDPDTGKGYKRKALEALVATKGHKAASSVNAKLDYLVTSDPASTSSKMTKAKKLGVVILGEDEFFEMI